MAGNLEKGKPTIGQQFHGLMTTEEKLIGSIFGTYPPEAELSARTPESFQQLLVQQASERLARVAFRVGEHEGTALTETELRQKEAAMFGTIQEQAQRSLSRLNPRERLVLNQRFGLESGFSKTQVEVGKLIERSTTTVRRIEKTALIKLRNPQT